MEWVGRLDGVGKNIWWSGWEDLVEQTKHLVEWLKRFDGVGKNAWFSGWEYLFQ